MKNLLRPITRLFVVVLLVAQVGCTNNDADRALPSSSGISFEITNSQAWIDSKGSDAPASHQAFGVYSQSDADPLFIHTHIDQSIDAAQIGTDQTVSRGTPVTSMSSYGAFTVWGYVYPGEWSESIEPNLMDNTQVQQTSGVWCPAGKYYWPGAGKTVRFFAYAPNNAAGLQIDASAGTPKFTYTVPDNVAEQKDILVASTGEYAGNNNSAVQLNFSHILTAVKFSVGSDMLAGRITRITLKNVYGSGSYTIGDGAWSDYGATRDFSQSIVKSLAGTPGETITDGSATFMMLPQTLSPDAAVEVVYTDNLTGITRTFSEYLTKGPDWPMGATVNYHLSTKSVLFTPMLSITAPGTYTYAGGSNFFGITSYMVVSRVGDPTLPVAESWTTQFSTDDGTTWSATAPSWLSEFTANGNGSLDQRSYTATVAPQSPVIINRHNETLMDARHVFNYNLASRGGTTSVNTANCYVVNAPGIYYLPLIYGNGYKDGAQNDAALSSSASGQPYVLSRFTNHMDNPITRPEICCQDGFTVGDVCLVWQDSEGLISDVHLENADGDIGYNLFFDVRQSTIRQGNAIVAVRDTQGRIAWSWHIWVTDHVPGSGLQEATNYQGISYNFMPVNVGWCDAEITDYAARNVQVKFTQTSTGANQTFTIYQTSHKINNSGNQPFYQFGRKDPMLPAIRDLAGETQDKGCYTEDRAYAFLGNGNGKVSIGTSIRNPNVFYNDGSDMPRDWCAASYYNLWNANNSTDDALTHTKGVKTIYDPSPAGFMLPPSAVWTGFTYNGSSVSGSEYYGRGFNSPYASVIDFTDNFGWEFYCKPMAGEGSFNTSSAVSAYPASGYRTGTSGAAHSVGSIGYLWSSIPSGTYYGRHLSLSASYVYPLDTGDRIDGLAVRAIQE